MFQVGISAIKWGNLASDGDVAPTFEEVGNTYKNVLSMNTTDDTTEDVYIEEADDPVLTVTTQKGYQELTWQTIDWTTDKLVAVFGGTVVNDQWKADANAPIVEKSLRIEPREGNPYIYPRVRLYPTVTKENSGAGLWLLNIRARVMKPTKAGVPTWMWGDQ